MSALGGLECAQEREYGVLSPCHVDHHELTVKGMGCQLIDRTIREVMFKAISVMSSKRLLIIFVACLSHVCCCTGSVLPLVVPAVDIQIDQDRK